MNRRDFLIGSVAATSLIASSLGAEVLQRGTRAVTVERLQITSRRIPEAFDGLRIAQLSDFHFDPYFNAPVIREAIRVANELKPEIVALTGDYVTKRFVHSGEFDRASASAALPLTTLLADLHPTWASFGVLGNHDYFTDPDLVASALETSGINVLRNAAQPLERQGSRLWIAGIDDVLGDAQDLRKALSHIPAEDVTILLAHEPDFADEVCREAVDLQLSGHSHGGQIRFPVLGAPYLPPLARKYPWGLRRIGRLCLYTNRGVGTIRIHARLNAAPEVTLITLKRSAA
jgi:predicted MPP superfamily phosphohydrolase